MGTPSKNQMVGGWPDVMSEHKKREKIEIFFLGRETGELFLFF